MVLFSLIPLLKTIASFAPLHAIDAAFASSFITICYTPTPPFVKMSALHCHGTVLPLGQLLISLMYCTEMLLFEAQALKGYLEFNSLLHTLEKENKVFKVNTQLILGGYLNLAGIFDKDEHGWFGFSMVDLLMGCITISLHPPPLCKHNLAQGIKKVVSMINTSHMNLALFKDIPKILVDPDPMSPPTIKDVSFPHTNPQTIIKISLGASTPAPLGSDSVTPTTSQVLCAGLNVTMKHANGTIVA